MKLFLPLGRVAGLLTATVSVALLVGCASSRYERTTGEFVDDQMLNRRVHHALNAQPVYKYPDVHVHSYRGVVQLSGFVATDPQRSAAAEIARRVRGVGEVENAISIAPLQDMTRYGFIPGRESDTNEVNRTSAGAPVRDVGVQSGSSSSSQNNVQRTNELNGAKGRIQ